MCIYLAMKVSGWCLFFNFVLSETTGQHGSKLRVVADGIFKSFTRNSVRTSGYLPVHRFAALMSHEFRDNFGNNGRTASNSNDDFNFSRSSSRRLEEYIIRGMYCGDKQSSELSLDILLRNLAPKAGRKRLESFAFKTAAVLKHKLMLRKQRVSLIKLLQQENVALDKFMASHRYLWCGQQKTIGKGNNFFDENAAYQTAYTETHQLNKRRSKRGVQDDSEIRSEDNSNMNPNTPPLAAGIWPDENSNLNTPVPLIDTSTVTEENPDTKANELSLDAGIGSEDKSNINANPLDPIGETDVGSNTNGNLPPLDTSAGSEGGSNTNENRPSLDASGGSVPNSNTNANIPPSNSIGGSDIDITANGNFEGPESDMGSDEFSNNAPSQGITIVACKIDAKRISGETETLLLDMEQNTTNQIFEEMIIQIQTLYCPSSTCGSINCVDKCDICNCGNDCSKYGSCCMDAAVKTPDMSSVCVSSERKYKNVTGYYMMGTCPDTYHDETIRTNCESTSLMTLNNQLPVYYDSVTYKNRFCAECHGITEFINWNIELMCTNVSSIPSSLQFTEAYDWVIEDWPCQMKTEWPPGIEVDSPSCTEWNLNVIISECNETGEWVDYNPYVERACHHYTQVFNGTYRNVFCYLCNRNSFNAYISNVTKGGSEVVDKPGGGFISMTQILDFSAGNVLDTVESGEEMASKKEIECDRGFRYDKTQGECKEIYCSPGKWYNGSHCIWIATTENDRKSYYTEMMLRPADMLNETLCFSAVKTDLFYAIQSHQIKFNNMLGTLKVNIDSVAKSRLMKQNSLDPRGYGIEFTVFEVVSHDYIDCKDGEASGKKSFGIRSTLHGFWTILVFNGEAWTLSDLIPDNVREFLAIQLSINSAQHGNITFVNDENSTYYMRRKSYPAVEIEILRDYHLLSYALKCYSKLHFCPYVILNMSDCEVLNGGKSIQIMPNTGSSYQDVPGNRVLVDYNDFEIIDETTVYVCSEIYFRQQQHFVDVISTTITTNQVEGLISMVLTCLSVVCLILTLTVYCILRSLRSVPGLNNMFLSTTLLLAQIVFQFGANQIQHRVLCKIIGVLAHYLWLSVILWMNVCSFHMFKVFGFLTSPVLESRKFNQLIKYAIYCFTVPLLFIVGNVVASLMLSDMRSIGYGDTICYINNANLLGLTFALPVGLVVLSNITMFTVVVISIRRQASASSFAASDKDYLNVYFRLSTITGSTWLFGFMYQWSGEIVLSYLFVALNASQGVFVFFAFVVSRTVMKKLRAHFAGDKKHGTVTNSTTLSIVG